MKKGKRNEREKTVSLLPVPARQKHILWEEGKNNKRALSAPSSNDRRTSTDAEEV